MEMEEYKRDACGSYLKEVAAFFDEIFPGKEKTLLRLCFPKQGLSTVCSADYALFSSTTIKLWLIPPTGNVL